MDWDVFVVHQTNRVLVLSLAQRLMNAGVISEEDYLGIVEDTIATLLKLRSGADVPELRKQYEITVRELLVLKDSLKASL